MNRDFTNHFRLGWVTKDLALSAIFCFASSVELSTVNENMLITLSLAAMFLLDFIEQERSHS
jgi:hypothetical protein